MSCRNDKLCIVKDTKENHKVTTDTTETSRVATETTTETLSDYGNFCQYYVNKSKNNQRKIMLSHKDRTKHHKKTECCTACRKKYK